MFKSRFANVWSQIKQLCVMFNYLNLWISVARHNIKWPKILINSLSRIGVNNLPVMFCMSYLVFMSTMMLEQPSTCCLSTCDSSHIINLLW